MPLLLSHTKRAPFKQRVLARFSQDGIGLPEVLRPGLPWSFPSLRTSGQDSWSNQNWCFFSINFHVQIANFTFFSRFLYEYLDLHLHFYLKKFVDFLSNGSFPLQTRRQVHFSHGNHYHHFPRVQSQCPYEIPKSELKGQESMGSEDRKNLGNHEPLQPQRRRPSQIGGRDPRTSQSESARVDRKEDPRIPACQIFIRLKSS